MHVASVTASLARGPVEAKICTHAHKCFRAIKLIASQFECLMKMMRIFIGGVLHAQPTNANKNTNIEKLILLPAKLQISNRFSALSYFSR